MTRGNRQPKLTAAANILDRLVELGVFRIELHRRRRIGLCQSPMRGQRGASGKARVRCQRWWDRRIGRRRQRSSGMSKMTMAGVAMPTARKAGGDPNYCQHRRRQDQSVHKSTTRSRHPCVVSRFYRDAGARQDRRPCRPVTLQSVSMAPTSASATVVPLTLASP
jgi:hypothetical protein